jgi:hypothetical protein
MTDTVDVAAKEVDPLADKIMTLKFSVSDINGILNALNQPFQTPTVLLANIIAAIQAQCGPQIDALNANPTAEKPADEPQATA